MRRPAIPNYFRTTTLALQYCNYCNCQRLIRLTSPVGSMLNLIKWSTRCNNCHFSFISPPPIKQQFRMIQNSLRSAVQHKGALSTSFSSNTELVIHCLILPLQRDEIPFSKNIFPHFLHTFHWQFILCIQFKICTTDLLHLLLFSHIGKTCHSVMRCANS